MKIFIAAAIGFASSALVPVLAAVSTSCGDPSTCTVAQLAAGDTITIGDVTFSLSNIDDFGTVAVDLDAITVTGVQSAGGASLLFAADPALSFAGDADFISLDFDLLAEISASSSAVFTSASLSAGADDLTISGDSSASVTFASDTEFLEIFDDAVFGEILTSAAALSSTTSFAALASIAALGFETASSASISAFRFDLALEGGIDGEIPLPAAWPLFLGGLAFVARVRRK
ncbi:MAG: hypothetical protein V2I43_11000 [Parvularcula sp.]|jgi:hypothetical protein|nr:hypothetical protein [Parvularcula sp.]